MHGNCVVEEGDVRAHAEPKGAHCQRFEAAPTGRATPFGTVTRERKNTYQ